jgi:nucleoside-diphosphate-sugar epimerase
VIFLTGGSGFLGKAVLDKLLDAGLAVRCIYRKDIPFRHEQVSWVKIDLSNPGLPDDLLKDCSSVIHCAGAIKGPKAHLERVNFQATRKLLKLSGKEKIKKFVFISSIDAVLFDTAYARSKKQAEELIEKAKLDWIIIRPSQIFGLKDTRNLSILSKLIKKLPIIPLPYHGNFKWEPVYVDDLAGYIASLTLNNQVRNRVFNVVGPETISFYEIVRVLQRFNNANKMSIPIPAPVMEVFRKTAGILLGKQKSEEIFSAFQDKIIGEGQAGQKIRLPTRFSEIYGG